jgi:hypothetical protein
MATPEERASLAAEFGASPDTIEPFVKRIPVFGESNETVLLNIVPKSASVEVPTPRKAGKFSIDLDFRDLPVDPRVLRSVGVTVMMGTVPMSEFAAGMVGNKDQRGRLRSYLDPVGPDGKVDLDKVLIVGTADEVNVTHDSSGSTVSMSGRDLRGLLLDSPMPAGLDSVVDGSQPIDKVVAQILRLHPMYKAEPPEILIDRTEFPGGAIPSPQGTYATPRILNSANPASGAKQRPNKRGSGKTSGQTSFWDVIVNLCNLCGAVPWFKGNALRINASAGLFQQLARAKGGGRTPFAGGRPRYAPNDYAGQAPISVRQLTFGNDIEEMTFDRKLSGRQETVVLCIAVDPTSKRRGKGKLIAEQYPPAPAPGNKAERAQVAPGGASKANVMRVPCPGITDRDQLAEMAFAIHQEVMRGTVGGSITTRILSSLGGSNSDPDLLRLRPADAIQIGLDQRRISSRSPVVAELLASQAAPFGEAVKRLTARGVEEPLARVLIATSRGGVQSLVPYFYVNNVKLDWSAESGIKVAFDFSNYIIRRYGPDREMVFSEDEVDEIVVKRTNTRRANRKAGAPVVPTAVAGSTQQPQDGIQQLPETTTAAPSAEAVDLPGDVEG